MQEAIYLITLRQLFENIQSRATVFSNNSGQRVFISRMEIQQSCVVVFTARFDVTRERAGLWRPLFGDKATREIANDVPISGSNEAEL